jgi:hypothetical protein
MFYHAILFNSAIRLLLFLSWGTIRSRKNIEFKSIRKLIKKLSMCTVSQESIYTVHKIDLNSAILCFCFIKFGTAAI